MNSTVTGSDRFPILSSQQRWKTVPTGLVWLFLLLVIAAVSVHDAALVVLNKESILEFERNPLGSFLIQLNQGSVWLFVGTKLLGTSFVCAVIASIYEFSQRLAMAITGPLAVFQTMLLVFLYCN